MYYKLKYKTQNNRNCRENTRRKSLSSRANDFLDLLPNVQYIKEH